MFSSSHKNAWVEFQISFKSYTKLRNAPSKVTVKRDRTIGVIKGTNAIQYPIPNSTGFLPVKCSTNNVVTGSTTQGFTLRFSKYTTASSLMASAYCGPLILQAKGTRAVQFVVVSSFMPRAIELRARFSVGWIIYNHQFLTEFAVRGGTV